VLRRAFAQVDGPAAQRGYRNDIQAGQVAGAAAAISDTGIGAAAIFLSIGATVSIRVRAGVRRRGVDAGVGLAFPGVGQAVAVGIRVTGIGGVDPKWYSWRLVRESGSTSTEASGVLAPRHP